MPNPSALSNVRNHHPKAEAYLRLRAGFAAMLRSLEPETKKKVEEMRQELSALRDAIERGEARSDVSPGSVHLAQLLNTFSIEYANEAFIADQVMPDVSVDKLEDKYATFRKRDQLAYPDDTVGDRGQGNEVSLHFDLADYKCLPRILRGRLEQKTIDNQDDIFDWFMMTVDNVLNGMAFNREMRCMNLVFTAGSYGGNTDAIGASSRWDSGSGGAPIKTIQTARDSVWRGKTGSTKLLGVTTLQVFRVLCNHPVILDKLRIKDGLASMTDLAAFFELDGLLVAKAWSDSANSGQAADIRRMVTAKSFGILAVANAPAKNTASFGYNLLFKGERRLRQWFEEKEGTRGTHWVKASCDDVPKIVAPDAGFLLTSVIEG